MKPKNIKAAILGLEALHPAGHSLPLGTMASIRRSQTRRRRGELRLIQRPIKKKKAKR